VSTNNLKQIALAWHNHADATKKGFPASSKGKDGKPLLSWRVALLPYLGKEEADLHKQFKLDEPWDSPHNKALIPKMPEVFRSPASRHLASKGLSTYNVFVGPHTAFPGAKGITSKQITDGDARTIMFVDVDDDHAEIWTKPGGLPFDGEELPQGMGGQFPDGISAAWCNGALQILTNPPVNDEAMRAILTIDGGEPVNW
jgi:hypothetical protein